jgi:uncharacterized membrane protein
VFVFLATGGIALGQDDEASFLVPIIGLVVVLAALGMVRQLQFSAYRSLQLGATLLDITTAGERVLDVLYPEPLDGESDDRSSLPPVTAELRWPRGLCLMRQVDTPKLVRWAVQHGAVVELRVGVGEELRRGVLLFAIRGGDHEDHHELLHLVDTGPDRTFDQDPLFAFRLLVDIALRAVSAAVNDPLTAVQAIAGVHELLHAVVDRELDNGRIGDADGALRVVLKVPAWDDFLAIGVDEITPYVVSTPQARQRLAQMVADLADEAPPSRRPSLEARRRVLATDAAPPLALATSPPA